MASLTSPAGPPRTASTGWSTRPCSGVRQPDPPAGRRGLSEGASLHSLVLAVVAQLVERNLAKVEVAGSSPVYRSTRAPHSGGGASLFSGGVYGPAMTHDLARLDAVAQAALVRSRRRHAARAGRRRHRAHRGTRTRRSTRSSTSFERARDEAASADLPDGPFRGVPFLLKDLWPTWAGDPYHMGIKALQDPATSTRRTPTCQALPGGRASSRSAGPTRRSWAWWPPPSRCPTGRPTTRGTSTTARVGPAGDRRPRWPRAWCPRPRYRRRWLDPHPGRHVRARRSQADPGAGLDGPAPGEWGVSVQHVVSHSVGTPRPYWMHLGPVRRRRGHRPASGRPWVDELSVTEPLRIGILDHALGGVPPTPSARRRPAGRRAGGPRHHVEDAYPSDLDRMGDHGPLVTTMWAVGAKASLLSLAPLLGRELTEDDVEPGTWALAEWGAVPRRSIWRRRRGRWRSSVVTWPPGGRTTTCSSPRRPPRPYCFGSAGGHRRRAAAGPDRLDALRHLHRGVQPERPARHLAAPAPDSRRPAARPDLSGVDRGRLSAQPTSASSWAAMRMSRSSRP